MSNLEEMFVRKPTLSEFHAGTLEVRAPVIDNEIQVGLKGDLEPLWEPLVIEVPEEAVAGGICRRIAVKLKEERPFQILYIPKPKGGVVAPSSYVLAHEVSEFTLVSETGKFWSPEPSRGLVVDGEGLEEFVKVLSTYGLDRQRKKLHG
ncbi:hypothetical protein EYC59_06340 [Candidatus Saccharibacteria bacterium]|nr:MAG: hypothetical protein EYC59_06340 [Candidatus Saccharibacteria bacterium]